jgi:hypothetical protein
MTAKIFSLAQQIDEIERELEERRKALPRLVGGRRVRESVAQFQIERLEAVLTTLKWLQAHDQAIKASVARPGEFSFKIERWSADDATLERSIAAADNLVVARAAFDAAVAAYPQARTTLRDGIRVIAKYPVE